MHIFRAGCYVAMSGQRVCLTANDIAGCALTYDPARHRAPLVIGHPQDNAPARGWVDRLAAQDGQLYAFAQASDELRKLVRAGHYGKVSASFWPPDHPENPSHGVWSLRHVGFLGAAVPAVLGLEPVSLSSGAGARCHCHLDAAGIEDAARRMAGLPSVVAAFGAPVEYITIGSQSRQRFGNPDPIEQAARRMAGLPS